MEIYVDNANLNKIKQISEFFPIDGFTTNPSILAQEDEDLHSVFPKYKEYINEKGLKIFAQVTARQAEDMFEQAKKLRDYFGKENFIVKLPATKEGYRAVRLCKQDGITTTVTVVHSVMQALVAAKAGADYVAPYVSHIDNIGGDGVAAVGEMLKSISNSGYECKVLGASFRTVQQIKDLAVLGCPAVTLAPDLFDLVIAHSSTDQSMVKFEKVWKNKFGDTNIQDYIPNN